MKVEPTRLFRRDVRNIGSADLRHRVEQIIEELIAASSITEVRNGRRMTARGEHYRFRIGQYRLGVTIDGDVAVLRRFLPRGELYRYFP